MSGAAAPGRLIGRGRSADVYDVGGGRVLRRYRDRDGAEFEARVMQHVRAHGFPAPEVFDAAGPDLVMQRLDGPTMHSDVGRSPQRLFAHAALLADLHRLLHAVPVLDGLRRPFGAAPAESILHLDFHPENVILTADGPMVIDWPNTAAGPAAADVGHTWVILATSEVSDVKSRVGRGLFLRAFLRGTDRAAAAAVLSQVAEYRLGDRNLVGREGVRIERLAQRYRGR